MSRNKAKKQSHNARMRLKRANYPKVITCICGVSGGGQSLFNRLNQEQHAAFSAWRASNPHVDLMEWSGWEEVGIKN